MKNDFRSIPTPYEMGVEFVSREEATLPPAPAVGVALYSLCEGDAPVFEAFFTKRWAADREAAKTDAEGFPLLTDAGVFKAVVVVEGMVVANDYTLTTHEKLRQRIAEWREAGWTG